MIDHNYMNRMIPIFLIPIKFDPEFLVGVFFKGGWGTGHPTPYQPDRARSSFLLTVPTQPDQLKVRISVSLPSSSRSRLIARGGRSNQSSNCEDQLARESYQDTNRDIPGSQLILIAQSGCNSRSVARNCS